jgi:selenocysteine lyase/cysteine desulfurase
MNWDIDNFTLSTNSRRFENGTPNPLPYIASLPGLQWVVEGGNDLQEIKNRSMTKELIQLLINAEINIVTPIEQNSRGGSVMVNVGTIENANQIITDCADESVLIDNRGHILRFSPGILTESFAIDCFVDCLKKNITTD